MSNLSLEYLCHVYVRNDSLAGVVIADSEYPSRVAFSLLEKVSLQCGRLALDGQMWTVSTVEGMESCVQNQPIFSFSSCSKPRDGPASFPPHLRLTLAVSGLTALVPPRPSSTAALQAPPGTVPEVSCGCTSALATALATLPASAFPGRGCGSSKPRPTPCSALWPPTLVRPSLHPRPLLSPLWVQHHYGT